MSEKLEELIESILMDGNDEFLDSQEGYISQDDYNRAINDKYMMHL